MASRVPRIVLVDDDADFLDITQLILSGGGYEVSAFADPDRAFDAIAREPPDLVITDLMMGRLDSGFSLARRIKSDDRFRSIPVIIISGIAHQRGYDFNPRGIAELDAMRAEAFFDKPVDPRALLARIRELLNRPEAPPA